jgi:RNA polymerase sigma-70 factor (ECF subfamily)
MRFLIFKPIKVGQRQDRELLMRLKRGDRVAVQDWYQRYRLKLLRHLLTKVTKTSDAEELTQDTFMSCLKHLPLFRGESSIWTWMLRIAGHEVADYYRKAYAKKAIQALPFDELLLTPSITDAHDTAQKVKDTLVKIRIDYRELLFLKYVDKKRVTEIAAELGRSVKSIESDLFRARKAFRQAYLATG